MFALALIPASSSAAGDDASGDGGSGPDSGALPTPVRSGGSAFTRKRAKSARKVVLAGFTVSRSGLVDGGRIKLRYRIAASAPRVRVRAVVRTRGGRFVKTVDLGVQRTNLVVTNSLSADDLGVSRAGQYKLRITARDAKNRAARRARRVPAWRGFSFSDHRFPVAGSFSFGGADARFGAGRPGHIHQGQDVIAAAGTPLVAPFSGQISWVAFQAEGAGRYVVEHADDGRDYVFMHMIEGSTLVKVGQRVRTGQRIGLLGSTGRSSGPHLHFEIWTGGPWQFGGRPIDPLPLLKSWLASGPGPAVRTSAAPALTAASDL